MLELCIYRNAYINGLQPRGIRLRQAHIGWDFDIHNNIQSFPLPRMDERKDRSIVLLFLSKNVFFNAHQCSVLKVL